MRVRVFTRINTGQKKRGTQKDQSDKSFLILPENGQCYGRKASEKFLPKEQGSEAPEFGLNQRNRYPHNRLPIADQMGLQISLGIQWLSLAGLAICAFLHLGFY
jgi:hypothetical protein